MSSSTASEADLQSHKRSRHDSTSTGELSKRPKRPDPYTTLPPPTSRFVTLYFQLCRFKRVFRIVRVPLNYTFANLHSLIQFLFGWSDSHAHAAEVYDNVELYKTKKGEIKYCGRPHQFQLEWDGMRTVPEETTLYGAFTARMGRGYGFGDYEEKLDWELTLNEVWNRNEELNASFAHQGDSPNENIAIKYTYDFGASWEVHISPHEEDLFWKRNGPSNLPIIVKANGAPTREDPGPDDDIDDEVATHKKPISPLMHAQDAFARYCSGDIRSVTLEDKLDVFTKAEEAEKYKEWRQRDREKLRARKEAGWSDIDSGDCKDTDEEEQEEEGANGTSEPAGDIWSQHPQEEDEPTPEDDGIFTSESGIISEHDHGHQVDEEGEPEDDGQKQEERGLPTRCPQNDGRDYATHGDTRSCDAGTYRTRYC